MAYIYFDENSPESTEYSSNYEYFDETEPGAIARMMRRCLQVEQNKRMPQKQYDITAAALLFCKKKHRQSKHFNKQNCLGQNH